MVIAINVRFDRYTDAHLYRNAEWLSQLDYHRVGDHWSGRYDHYTPVYTQSTLSERNEVKHWVRTEIADAVTQEHPQFVAVYTLWGVLRAKVMQNAVVDNSVIAVITSGDLNALASAINAGNIPAPKRMTIKAVLPLIEHL